MALASCAAESAAWRAARSRTSPTMLHQTFSHSSHLYHSAVSWQASINQIRLLLGKLQPTRVGVAHEVRVAAPLGRARRRERPGILLVECRQLRLQPLQRRARRPRRLWCHSSESQGWLLSWSRVADGACPFRIQSCARPSLPPHANIDSTPLPHSTALVGSSDARLTHADSGRSQVGYIIWRAAENKKAGREGAQATGALLEDCNAGRAVAPAPGTGVSWPG